MAKLMDKDQEIHFKQTKIDLLTHEIARYKRLQFAAKSEHLQANQRSLLDETLDADLAALEAELQALSPAPATSEALATSAAQPTEVEHHAGENAAQPAGETGAPSPEGAPATSSGQTPGALLPTPSAATTTEPGASTVLEGAAVEQGGKLTGSTAPSPSAVMSGEQPASPAPAEPASTAPAAPSAASPTGDGVPAK